MYHLELFVTQIISTVMHKHKTAKKRKKAQNRAEPAEEQDEVEYIDHHPATASG